MCAWECAGVCRCGRECMGMRVCALVCAGVRRCARVCTGVCGYVWVWDVFSEFLLENRVPTSADFNTFPIRILLYRIALKAQIAANQPFPIFFYYLATCLLQ